MNKIYSQKLCDKIITSIFVSVYFSYVFIGLSTNNKLPFILLFIIGLTKLFNRDFYLPFLGDTVIPQYLIPDQKFPPNYNYTVTVNNLPPFSKVMFWASMPKSTENNNLNLPWTAYNKYKNSGSTITDENGSASFNIMYPQPYKTPYGKKLKPHVHYRFFRTNGMLSRIETKFI